MKTVVLESSLRSIVREELIRYINEGKQEQVLEEGKLGQSLSGLALALGLGSGVAGAKLTSELPSTPPTMAAMQSIAGDIQIESDFVYNQDTKEIKYKNEVIGSMSDFAYDKNTKKIKYKNEELGSISLKTEELIRDYYKIKGSKARSEFLEKNRSQLQELETIINSSAELKNMMETKRSTGIALLAALVLLIGGSMGLVLASEGGPATGLYAGRGSVVRTPRAPYGKTG